MLNTVSLVLGGCCSNAFSLEALLTDNPALGSTLTFSQLLFIALQATPSVITWQHPTQPRQSRLPRLKRRNVPLYQWLFQVVLLTLLSLLNNWAFRFRVPLALQILIRSAGLVVSMLVGYVFLNKKYTKLQIFSVLLVTMGVVAATVSRPTPSSAGKRSTEPAEPDALFLHSIGVAMLVFSLLVSGILGALQERTFAVYGPHWREGMFYTHLLSLPTFLLLLPEVKQGFSVLGSSKQKTVFGIPIVFGTFAINVFTQSLCVSGVNNLTSRVSSVTTNLILTTRKALSLCISVWYFGNGWNTGMTVGASFVFIGTLLYAWASRAKPKEVTKDRKEE